MDNTLSKLNGREYYVAYRSESGEAGIVTYYFDARRHRTPEGQGLAIARKQAGSSLRAFQTGTALINERR